MVFSAVARHFSKPWAIKIERDTYTGCTANRVADYGKSRIFAAQKRRDTYENRNGPRKDFSGSGFLAVDEITYADGDIDQDDGRESVGTFRQTKRDEV